MQKNKIIDYRKLKGIKSFLSIFKNPQKDASDVYIDSSIILLFLEENKYLNSRGKIFLKNLEYFFNHLDYKDRIDYIDLKCNT